MYCPNCGTEYQADAKTCSDCCAELVDALPEEESEGPDYEWQDLETVFVTSDPALLPVVKSLLDAEGIDTFIRNEMLQEFMGIGRIVGPNLVAGSIQVQVRPGDAEQARALLKATDFSAVDFPESS